ncbi:MAG: hypothetical protein ACKVT2_12920 [Saprospiraceae bacterium]
MNVAEIKSSPLNETIRRVEKWETSDVEQLLKEVSGVLVRRKMRTLPTRESDLLLQINQSAFSPESANLYKTLRNKLQSETITKDEHSNLLVLSQTQEQHNIERLRCLIELAQIRNISLDDLMRQLGVTTVASYA